MKDPLHERLVRREPLFRGNYLSTERYHILLPDGRHATREIVLTKSAVAVLPLDDQGKVHLVRQHRPAIGKTIVEVPAGLVEKGESFSAAARRECEEETGWRPGKLTKLLTYAQAEGYATGNMTLFLGTHLKHTGKIHLDDSEFIVQAPLPFNTLLSWVRRGKVIDSKTILCALLSAPRLSRARP